MMEDKGRYLESAIVAARMAGSRIRRNLGRPPVVELKGPSDLVTSIDRACEHIINDYLTQAHPEVDFWGEECGQKNPEALLTWIVDPLDGTKNFVHGYPFVAVSIALVYAGEPQVGVVFDPLRDELFQAIKGKGAFLNGMKLEVSRTRKLADALVVTSFAPWPPKQKELIWQACTQCQGLRRGGASALDLCQLAAGRLDAIWEWRLQPWDLAAATLILHEAQGTITDHDGKPFELSTGRILASNTSLHRAMVDFLNF